MKAFLLDGCRTDFFLMNGARMPSTDDDVSAETRNAALRTTADRMCGLDFVSFTLSILRDVVEDYEKDTFRSGTT